VLIHVTDPTQPRIQTPVSVPVDHYQVVAEDRLLCAHLAGSFAVCISDEVFEAGALLHMQAGRPGKATDAELTDNTLSMDLLLLDRCLAELRAVEPQARHWQARFFGHADPNAGGEERLLGLRAFFEAALEDAGVAMAGGNVYEGATQWLTFRPALRQLRCEAESS
jgi:chemotaxis receptor (MCP) glutamine deamidase CheD